MVHAPNEFTVEYREERQTDIAVFLTASSFDKWLREAALLDPRGTIGNIYTHTQKDWCFCTDLRKGLAFIHMLYYLPNNCNDPLKWL